LRPNPWGGWGTVVPGGDGRWTERGEIYAQAGTITLRLCNVDHNSAVGGRGGTSPRGLPRSHNDEGWGGGLMNTGAVVYPDSYTVSHLLNNTADKYPDIYGAYTPLL
jgi:hypothetical protein